MGTTRVLAWAAIALVAVDLVFLSGASNFLAAPQSRILNQVIVLAMMIGLGVAVVRGRVDVRSPLILPGLAWIGATAISATFSDRPTISLEGLALLLLAAPAYLAVRGILTTDWLRERIDWLVIVSTTVFVVAYLLQALTQWISWWSVAGPSVPPLRPGDVGLTVGTVNAVSLYLELLAPVAVWLSWTRWQRKPFTVALAVLSLFALVVTGSRGAWLGAAAGAAALALIAWLAAGRPRPRLRGAGRSSGPLVAIGIVVAVLAVVASPVLLPRLLAGDAGRLELWSAAWSMFVSHPLAGVGLGGWPDARAFTPISEANLAILTTAHDSILQVLAETGILGLIAGLWLTVTVVITGWRSITGAADRNQRILRMVCLASLAAVAVHSLVDTQFHLPAVVLLTMHLVARLDPPAAPATADAAPPRPSRIGIAIGGAAVLIGAVILVPIDIAMIRGQVGNLALDRGDATTAAREFDAAIALHDLPSYRLGQAIARGHLADAGGAAAALARLEELAPFTFSTAQRAVAAADPGALDGLLDRAEAAGAYDPTATANVAALRFATDPGRATEDLARAMAGAPTLVYSTRPESLFDDATWTAAQTRAIDLIGAGDPALAAAVAILAGHDEDAATQRAAVTDPAVNEALDQLQAAATSGTFDLEASKALLRANATSQTVQGILWMLGFEAESQPLIDAVKAVSVPQFFGTPLPPLELVIDGRRDADYSLRLPRWPMAETSRQAPKRPFVDGMITIEPVFRPKTPAP